MAVQRKFKSKKEQLAKAHELLTIFERQNTGGISPITKQIIKESYLNRVK